jgi:hypothetical protein
MLNVQTKNHTTQQILRGQFFYRNVTHHSASHSLQSTDFTCVEAYVRNVTHAI